MSSVGLVIGYHYWLDHEQNLLPLGLDFLQPAFANKCFVILVKFCGLRLLNRVVYVLVGETWWLWLICPLLCVLLVEAIAAKQMIHEFLILEHVHSCELMLIFHAFVKPSFSGSVRPCSHSKLNEFRV
jgi:hypothetical protein